MTTIELQALWRQRDIRYERRREAISDRERDCVLDFRRREVELIPAGDRVRMLAALAQWSPRTVG
jgi:hypothetical protein